VKLVGVKKYFPITRGILIQRKIGQVHAVDGIDLEVYPGETIGLVGETGCGKSTTARLITKLLDVTAASPSPETRLGQAITWVGVLVLAVGGVLSVLVPGLFPLILMVVGVAAILIGQAGQRRGRRSEAAIAAAGRIFFDGRDITNLSRRQMRPFRREIQMIFQDPYASLNPRKTVGSIIAEPFQIHRTVPRDKIKGEVQRLMELVGLNPEHYNRFPHEFSGGQRQRVGVARALALRPKLIVCDEPVSALDVSIQAQILNLLEDLQEEFHLTYVFIAHDLSVVKHMSDRVAVMYLGRIVEIAPGETLYRDPKHPYTGALLSAVPIPDPKLAAARKRIILEGDVPSPIDPPSGCRFHPRCPRAQFPICKEQDPELTPHHRGQLAACHFPLEDRAVVESSA
jgi:oligopeptide/dipeptide ABC transporter ATP-binding protein